MYEVSESLDPVKKNSYTLPDLGIKMTGNDMCHSACIDKKTSRLISIDDKYIYVQKDENSKVMEKCKEA